MITTTGIGVCGVGVPRTRVAVGGKRVDVGESYIEAGGTAVSVEADGSVAGTGAVVASVIAAPMLDPVVS